MADIDTRLRALTKRGFRQDDPYLHECSACKKMKVAKFTIARGSIGGRDIDICVDCGAVRSWRRRGMNEEREEDLNFDLDAFLA